MKILFVCTGNTCRSPMAQVMAAELFGDKCIISSAGVMAMPDSAASNNAAEAMKERNIDLLKHKSQMVTEALLTESDLILAMTTSHKSALLRMLETDPLAAAKIWTLGEFAETDISVSDPYGGDINIYRACAEEIHGLLEKIQEKIKGK